MHTAKIETYLTVAALNLCILPFCYFNARQGRPQLLNQVLG